MYRIFVLLLVAGAVSFSPISPAYADDANWPSHDEVNVPDQHDFARGHALAHSHR